MLRWSPYEAANVLLSKVKRPCTLQQWGRKIAEAKGTRRAGSPHCFTHFG
jgi:hypothetical protein